MPARICHFCAKSRPPRADDTAVSTSNQSTEPTHIGVSQFTLRNKNGKVHRTYPHGSFGHSRFRRDFRTWPILRRKVWGPITPRLLGRFVGGHPMFCSCGDGPPVSEDRMQIGREMRPERVENGRRVRPTGKCGLFGHFWAARTSPERQSPENFFVSRPIPSNPRNEL